MARNPGKVLFWIRDRLFPFLLILALTSCASGVDMVRFTSETYPPAESVGSVEVLEKAPDRPYTKLAQITIGNSRKSGALIQVKIKEEAAKLGADAVVFSDPVASFSGGTKYAPVYRPWGYYSPYYGGYYGGAYVTASPMPYKVKHNTLSGLAIRYTDG